MIWQLPYSETDMLDRNRYKTPKHVNKIKKRAPMMYNIEGAMNHITQFKLFRNGFVLRPLSPKISPQGSSEEGPISAE